MNQPKIRQSYGVFKRIENKMKKQISKISGKKAQEEIVGFVLIIVLVAVIAVIFLGISLRQPSTANAQQSTEISSFLNSISSYTSDCEEYKDNYKSVKQLIAGCYEGRICIDSRAECEVLHNTLNNLVSSTYTVANGSRIWYYSLKLEDDTEQKLIADISASQSGEYKCPYSLKYNDLQFSSGSGKILNLRLDICYATVD